VIGSWNPAEVGQCSKLEIEIEQIAQEASVGGRLWCEDDEGAKKYQMLMLMPNQGRRREKELEECVHDAH
jgi:hypothetical protein